MPRRFTHHSVKNTELRETDTVKHPFFCIVHDAEKVLLVDFSVDDLL